MEITKNCEGNTVELALKGRLDTITAPKLEEELGTLPGVETLILNFAELEYISSAGLRVLLAAQKIMNKQGKMVLRQVCDDIMEVFDITGFCDILTIE